MTLGIKKLRKKFANRKTAKKLLIVLTVGSVAYLAYTTGYAGSLTYSILERIRRSPVSEVEDPSPSPRKPWMLIGTTIGGIILGTVVSSRSSIPEVDISTPGTTRPTWVTVIYFGMGYLIGKCSGC